jgi:hypothetical protein
VHDNTTPSSNTHNVIHSVERRITFDHVVHWYVLQVSNQIKRTNLCIKHTETITALYDHCLLEAVKKDFQFFSRTFFFSCLPFYMRCKLQQDGLCPYHHIGIALHKELVRKRKFWHINCHCSCTFCSPDGCNHGANFDSNYAEFSCSKCVDCPCEWCDISTNWLCPEQLKCPGGGIYWVNQKYINTRREIMQSMRAEMTAFWKHAEQVIYQKKQMRELHTNFKPNEIIVKADFIQNISHSHGCETSQSYYGKQQTQFLVFVVWYWNADGIACKKYLDYLSSYLKHNFLFFQKCFLLVLEFVSTELGVDFCKVVMEL